MSRRGQITDRGENRWLVRAFLGRDPKTGTRRYHNKTIYGTKREASQYLTKVLRDLDTGLYVEQSQVTLGDFLDKWLDVVAKPRVSERTLADYRENLSRYVRPTLEERRLQDLRPFEIQTLYAGMLERGLSPRTVRATHAPLRSALDQAVKWQFVSRNPARLVDLPKQPKQERHVLTAEEASRFLANAKQDRLHALWVVLLTTGLRPGEALGLRWEDWEGERLRVQRSLTRTAEGGWVLAEPKTSQSRRSVTLPGSTGEALSAHRVNQAREKLQLGARYQDEGLVFCTAQGTPLDLPGVTRRHFHPILKAAGLERIRVYDLQTHLRDVAAGGRRTPEDRERTTRARLGDAHAGYLQPCPTGHAGERREKARRSFVWVAEGGTTARLRCSRGSSALFV